VDTAREYVTIPKGSIEPPPAGITGLSAQYLEGIATLKGRIVLVLKLDAVLDIGQEINGAKHENSGAKQER
jgi:purine-binding chemotaxis protein CheW